MNNASAEIGGIDYFLNNLMIYLPYAIILFIALLIGTIGNLMVIASILISKELKANSTFILIINLAMADFFISFFSNSAHLITLFVGSSFFQNHKSICYILSCLSYLASGVSLSTQLFLALNRFVLIFHFSLYSKLFSMRIVYILNIFSWMFTLALIATAFTAKWTDVVYDDKILYCKFDRVRSSFLQIAILPYLLIPSVIIGFCYLKIYLIQRASKERIYQSRSRSISIQTFQLAKSLFFNFFFYIVCWLPVASMLVFDRTESLNRALYVFLILVSYLNSALNPILHGLFISKIREGYIDILYKIKFSFSSMKT